MAAVKSPPMFSSRSDHCGFPASADAVKPSHTTCCAATRGRSLRNKPELLDDIAPLARGGPRHCREFCRRGRRRLDPDVIHPLRHSAPRQNPPHPPFLPRTHLLPHPPATLPPL